MKFVVTGAAGFIGSNLVKKLNEYRHTDIILVDRVHVPAQVANLSGLQYVDLIDYADPDLWTTIDRFRGNEELVVFHQGACTDTLNNDGKYMLEMNHATSKRWLDFCQVRNARLIYASSAAVYGHGRNGFVLNREEPLNVYGLSKLLFDRHVMREVQQRVPENGRPQVAGLRYFNVYGPGEFHKGKMSSCILQFYLQSLSGKIDVFRGSKDFRRDFIHINNVIDANMFLLKNPDISGVFNCGTGVARSFYEVAQLIVQSHGVPFTYELHRFGTQMQAFINEVDMPFGLQASYQRHTQADMTALRALGFSSYSIPLEEGIKSYVKLLEK